MATRVTVEVKGLRELGERMRALSRDVATKTLKSAATAGANKIRDKARQIAVSKGLVDSGDMVKAIGVKRDRRGSRAGVEYRAIGVWSLRGRRKAKAAKGAKWRGGAAGEAATPDYYWKFAELGTVKQRPQPYLRPALAQAGDAAVEAIKQRLKARIDRAGQR